MQSVRLLRIRHNVLRLWKMLLMTLCVIRVSFLTYSCMSSRLFCFQTTKVLNFTFSDEHASKTASIISSYDNPENINSSPEGAPSKRLLAIKPDYNKVLEGNLIALEVGIEAIIVKMPAICRMDE